MVKGKKDDSSALLGAGATEEEYKNLNSKFKLLGEREKVFHKKKIN